MKRFEKWVKRVLNYASEWGNQRVPDDIRWAVNDVQAGLGVPPTEFGVPAVTMPVVPNEVFTGHHARFGPIP